MNALINNLMNDEAGFVVSAELILVSTIAVLGMVVGLSEVALNVSSELEDVGSAFGSVTQTYHISGLMGHMGSTGGSCFTDLTDFCDRTGDIVPNNNITGEGGNQFN